MHKSTLLRETKPPLLEHKYILLNWTPTAPCPSYWLNIGRILGILIHTKTDGRWHPWVVVSLTALSSSWRYLISQPAVPDYNLLTCTHMLLYIRCCSYFPSFPCLLVMMSIVVIGFAITNNGRRVANILRNFYRINFIISFCIRFGFFFLQLPLSQISAFPLPVKELQFHRTRMICVDYNLFRHKISTSN